MRSIETSTLHPHQFLNASTPQSALIAHGRREDTTPTWGLVLLSLPRLRKSLITSYSIASVKNVLDGQLSDETKTLKYTRSGMILTKPTVESTTTTQDPANLWNRLLQSGYGVDLSRIANSAIQLSSGMVTVRVTNKYVKWILTTESLFTKKNVWRMCLNDSRRRFAKKRRTPKNKPTFNAN